MKVLAAMSGGVDSSVTAWLLLQQGHEVVGATMKLWGGASDSGCCSVSDTEDARRVCDRLGIVHRVFNFSDDFDTHVVEPYVAGYAAGLTPNPCVECNRHLKFDRFMARAWRLGFDAVATGHHARVTQDPDGTFALRRGMDPAKDQSYVLNMLGQEQLSRLLLPVGEMHKSEVRRLAAQANIPTATKPDSQDVCFISRSGGRLEFLSSRVELHPGEVVSPEGEVVGRVPSVELVTVGQRKNLGNPGGAVGGAGTERLFAVDVDVPAGRIRLGHEEELMVSSLSADRVTWTAGVPAQGTQVEAQVSAHGQPVPGYLREVDGQHLVIGLDAPTRRVAAGQSVVVYHGDRVLGGGLAVSATG